MNAKTPSRPQSVPEAATFHQEWGEWVLGEKKGDACVGEWKQWHATEGHMTCIDVYDADGNLQHVTRFHPDGTFSQKVPHHDGKPHGVAEYQRSNNPSEERSMESSPDAVFRLQLFWEHGGQPRPARFFDEAGREIGTNGQPKPEGIHEQARSTPEGLWVLTKAVLQDDYEGVDTAWRSDGSLRFEQHYAEDGTMKLHREYHPDGTQASERNYETLEGWHRNAQAETDIDPPKMPGDAQEVRFAIQVVNPKTGLFWARDQVFLDAEGKELSDSGLTIRKPHPEAYLVKEKTWHEPKTCWRHDEEAQGRRVTSTWRREGTLLMRTEHEGDKLVSHVSCDEEGNPRIEEIFFPREEDERPVNQSVTFHTDTGRIEVACNEDGTCKTFTRYEGDALVETIDNGSLEITLDNFEAEFERRFGAIQKLEDSVVWFGFFDICSVGVESFDEFFKAAAIAGNGGGDEVVVLLEGKHAGELYFNFHDEGLYALECVDDYVDEEGLDVEELSKDALIEEMPFMENELAENLTAFVRGIKVNAHRTYWKSHGEFVRIGT